MSVEHLGQMQDSARFRNCIFRNNRTQTTGSGVDLLHGSRATIENCLFVGNVSNMGVDYVGLLTGGEYHPEHGSGAMTVFEGSRATVSSCTFTGNWNGVDDDGDRQHLRRFDLLEEHAARAGSPRAPATSSTSSTAPACEARFIHGDVNDLRGTIESRREHVRSAGSALRRAVRSRTPPEYARSDIGR